MKIQYKNIYDSWHEYFEKIVELEDIFGGDSWDRDSVLDELSKSHNVFGAFADGELIGYTATTEEPDCEYIWTVVINLKYQGKGIGAGLLKSMLKPWKKYRLDVRMDNYGAIKLYDQLGFKIVDSQEEFYFDECPSLVFEK